MIIEIPLWILYTLGAIIGVPIVVFMLLITWIVLSVFFFTPKGRWF